MEAIRLHAVVGTDHRLQLELPPEIPAGEVEVIILATKPSSPQQSPLRTLREFNNWLGQQQSTGRNKKEIDRYLVQERASWD
ncbi:MAG: hypothetical protein WA970_14965 [Gammaproteobacteria bacterium]|nr:hypothetical protein [Gammaproteobacteria bacterium]